MSRETQPNQPGSPGMALNAAYTLVGALFAAALAAFGAPTPEQLALWCGPLVIVPMGLRLIARGSDSPSLLLSLILTVQGPAAGLFVGAWFVESTVWAVALALPWFGLTLLCALLALSRLVIRGLWPASEWPTDAGLLYIVVGSSWAILSLVGARPMGFSDIIVFLTAVHFHYAGFAMPVLCGVAARGGGRLPVIIGGLVILAIPAVAAGITLGPWAEAIAAPLMAAGGLALGGWQLALAWRSSAPALSRLLLGLSGAVLFGTMSLGALYGLREVLPLGLDMPWMIRWHGIPNALGFAFCGLLSWTLAELPEVSTSSG